jgi:hypothetical protein
MKFVAIILISFAAMAVLSTPIPKKDDSREESRPSGEQGSNEGSGSAEDQCGFRLTIENQCAGKNETICFDCLVDACYALYEQDHGACETVNNCLTGSGC